MEIIRILFIAGADINQINSSGWPVLFYAVYLKRDLALIQAFITAGADVNYTD